MRYSARRSRARAAGRMSRTLVTTTVLMFTLEASTALAEDRSIDGTGNNASLPTMGSAGEQFIRFGYEPTFPGDGTGTTILDDAVRPNPRDISNRLSTQTTSTPSGRNLSDYIWVWGQFLDHDIDLAAQSDGPGTNGAAHIPVHDPSDILAPGPIPFTRSNFDIDENGVRQNPNMVTSWIDASNVYGSDPTRAAALRSESGTGALLHMNHDNLLAFNTLGLANDNEGRTPSDQLFLAGDVRANENVLLTSMHTVFAREHNRLVGMIQSQQPELNDEQTYQLARKIVGAEMQIITYNEFLPALLGNHAPTPEDYLYDPDLPGTITQSFAAAAYRFGHSTLSSNLQMVEDGGTPTGSITLAEAFFNPNFISTDPTRVDQFLKGAATQLSQEVDTLIIDDVRNLLFGPPGAGGMDLAALNIQRGRDHGLPDYNTLRPSYGLPPVTGFTQITSNTTLAAELQSLYGTVDNIDAWVGALAEDHLPDASVGELINAIVANQFARLRDADRLFYLSDDLGLYTNGTLNDDIESIINLDTLRLSDVIAANTDLNSLQSNVFFVVPEPTAALVMAATGIALITPKRRQRPER